MRLSAGILMVSLGLTASAHADQAPTKADRARQLAAKAAKLAASGDIAGAMKRSKEALALDDRADYLCNIGLLYKKQNKLAAGHLFLSRCLARGATMKAKHVASFRRILGDVETALRAGSFAPVEIRTQPVGARVRVSHFAEDESFPSPLSVWLPVGSHEVTVSAPGFDTGSRTIEITSKSRVPLSVELTRTKVAPPKPVVEPGTKSPTPKRIAKPKPAPVPAATPKRSRKVVWLLYAGAGAALAGAGVFHVMAYGTRQDLVGRVPSAERTSEVETLARQRRIAYALYGVGAVTAAAATYLLFRKRGAERRSVEVSAAVRPGGGSLWLTWAR